MVMGDKDLIGRWKKGGPCFAEGSQLREGAEQGQFLGKEIKGLAPTSSCPGADIPSPGSGWVWPHLPPVLSLQQASPASLRSPECYKPSPSSGLASRVPGLCDMSVSSPCPTSHIFPLPVSLGMCVFAHSLIVFLHCAVPSKGQGLGFDVTCAPGAGVEEVFTAEKGGYDNDDDNDDGQPSLAVSQASF